MFDKNSVPAEKLSVGQIIPDWGKIVEIKHHSTNVVLKIRLGCGKYKYLRWRRTKLVLMK
jgi:hypothetical protein